MSKAARSKRIELFDAAKIKQVNAESRQLVRQYKKDMVLRELSSGTITGYMSDINQWLIYVLENQENRSVLELDEDDLTDFFYFCKSNGNNTRRMRRRYASISAFYKFLRRKRKIAENPMEFVDRPIKDNDVITQTFLTVEQVKQMKQKLSEYGDLTLECYVLFSLSTMARVNAVAHLRWKQIDYGQRIAFGVVEKEGKVVNLYFSSEVCQKLIQLQQMREMLDIDDGGYVFFSKDKSGHIAPITASTLHHWTRKVGKMIGPYAIVWNSPLHTERV